MSAVIRFNRSAYQVQDARPDVRRIIQHVRQATHTCKLLATGYCRDCPAYLVFRNNRFSIIDQASIPFPYEEEYLLANTVATQMLARHTSFDRSQLPTFQRTGLNLISPPVEMNNHHCPTCQLQHLSDHTCPPCQEPHLRDHTCPVVPVAQDEVELPDDETETDVSQGNPAVPDEVWRELRNLLNRVSNAAPGTPLHRLNAAMTSTSTNAATLIAALRPTTTTITNTVYVPAPCTRQHAEDVVPPPCPLEHFEVRDPSLPPMPPSVLSDPTVAQTTVSVLAQILSHPSPPRDAYSTVPTRRMINSVNRALQHHQVNESPEQASESLLRALRWSASMHRQEELDALPHAVPCMYHPCPISGIYEWIQANNIPHNQFVNQDQFIRWFLHRYFNHLQSHAYPASFIQQVLTPMPFHGRAPNVYDVMRPYNEPFTVSPMHPSQHNHTALLPRLPFDYDTQPVPNSDTSVIIPIRQ
jgi:hypothetical protein